MTDDVALDSEVASIPDDSSNEDIKEKMLPVSRVEELVKKAKLKGRDSMQQELDALKAENAQLKNTAAPAAPVAAAQPPSMGGMATPTIDTDAITQKVMAGIQKQMQEANEERANKELQDQATQIANSYRTKMQSGKDSYEDFDTVMQDFNPQAFPNLVYLAAQVDNTPDVMYELMKNPSKWATLAVLSERDPQAAQTMINRISTSAKANQQAKAENKEAPPPLSRLSSSKTGQDNGKLEVRDYKKIYRG